MDKRTSDALEGSIRKWRKIAADTRVNHGTDDCLLCQLFIKGRPQDQHCAECPVAESGHSGCSGTPYFDYTFAISAENRRAAATREAEFLESMRDRPVVVGVDHGSKIVVVWRNRFTPEQMINRTEFVDDGCRDAFVVARRVVEKSVSVARPMVTSYTSSGYHVEILEPAWAAGAWRVPVRCEVVVGDAERVGRA